MCVHGAPLLKRNSYCNNCWSCIWCFKSIISHTASCSTQVCAGVYALLTVMPYTAIIVLIAHGHTSKICRKQNTLCDL